MCVLCVLSEENTPLDLDDHGGRTFLRVLLHLTMHDYPPLVSRALHLLFRHFSQRQEVLQAFKQVSCQFVRYKSKNIICVRVGALYGKSLNVHDDISKTRLRCCPEWL